MKNRFKVSFLSTVALVIASLVCTGSVLAKSTHVKSKPHPGGQCYEFINQELILISPCGMRIKKGYFRHKIDTDSFINKSHKRHKGTK